METEELSVSPPYFTFQLLPDTACYCCYILGEESSGKIGNQAYCLVNKHYGMFNAYPLPCSLVDGRVS